MAGPMSEGKKKSIPEIIGLKRDGGKLSREDIEHWVENLVSGTVADCQLGAWLMAVYLKGLDEEETSHLTSCMVCCGSQLVWPVDWDRNLIVDKHSTGGVGDKVSLPLAPALAAAGLKVPMVSGRGLGMTGGTLDKLESIPNFRVHLSEAEITAALETVGCCIVGQTEQICPADRLMYRARDITGTVGSQGLITSSIISKKMAEGISSLVLDVKWGLGSYQDTEIQAEALATSLMRTSRSLGVNTTAVISHMNSPLGRAVGNSLEVVESLLCLRGEGPVDLRELVCVQGALLLQSAGLCTTREEGFTKIAEVLDNGAALERFRQMLVFQGVDEQLALNLVKGEQNTLTVAENTTTLVSETSGYITQLHAGNIASVAGGLGAGRTAPGGTLDHSVGILLHKSLGDRVEEGEVWVEVHHNKPLLEQDLLLLRTSLGVGTEPAREERISKIIN